jgi:antitoxin component of MazEF toxin-antitoxin module
LAQYAKNPRKNQGLPAERTGTELFDVFPMFLESSKGSRRGIAGIRAELGSSPSSLENDVSLLTSGNSKAIMYLHWSTIGIDCSVEQVMIKNLVKHGNSWAVVIDRPILDLLKIAPESQVELTTDGKSIRIAPVDSDDKKAKVRAARAKVNSKHSKAFKKLAE